VALLPPDRPPGCVGSSGCRDAIPDVFDNPIRVDAANDTISAVVSSGMRAGRKPRKRKAPKAEAPRSPKPLADGSVAGPVVEGEDAGTQVGARHHASLVAAVANAAAATTADGLVQEVALLRTAILNLAEDGDAAKSSMEDIKVLAELRLQVAALCRTLKTQKDLRGSVDDTVMADLTRALDELDDGLGVSR
jgi:hypothetical protein